MAVQNVVSGYVTVHLLERMERRNNTHRNYLSCVRNLEVMFGRKYLDEITPQMIRAFKEARIELQRRPATINRDYRACGRSLGLL